MHSCTFQVGEVSKRSVKMQNWNDQRRLHLFLLLIISSLAFTPKKIGHQGCVRTTKRIETKKKWERPIVIFLILWQFPQGLGINVKGHVVNSTSLRKPHLNHPSVERSFRKLMPPRDLKVPTCVAHEFQVRFFVMFWSLSYGNSLCPFLGWGKWPWMRCGESGGWRLEGFMWNPRRELICSKVSNLDSAEVVGSMDP